MMQQLVATGVCLLGSITCPPDPNYEPPQPFVVQTARGTAPPKSREYWEARAQTAAAVAGADRDSMIAAMTGGAPWRYGTPPRAEEPAFVGLDRRFTLELQKAKFAGTAPTWRVIEQAELTKIVPKELWEAYKATLDASGISDNNDLFDPASVLTAVHALHVKGKAKAVEAMEWHVSLSGDECSFGPTLFGGDATSVCVLAGLLFEPRDKAGRGSLFPFGGCGVEATSEFQTAHPAFPLVVQDGIPFWLGRGWMLGGMPGTPSQVLAYVTEREVFASKPLTPTCDPVTAAERLLASATWKGVDTTARAFSADGKPLPEYGRIELREAVIIQALRALPPDMRPIRIRSAKSGTNIDEESWAAVKKAVVERRVRWDASKRTFIADPVVPPAPPSQPPTR